MKKFWNRKRIIIPIALLMVGMIATVAAAAVLLFTHTFPSVTVPGVAALVTSNCTTMVGFVNQPANGWIGFGCSPNGATAFAFQTGTSGIGVVTSGGIPAGLTSLVAVACPGATCNLGGTTCSAPTSSGILLSSNPAPASSLTITVSAGTTLAANTQYIYCAAFTNPSTSSLVIPTFTVNWQQ
jgi:hypothetical protein